MATDICRVCRSEGTPEKPLFHPCICTGSIRYIHQDCLVQWLKYSKKEYCELCKHKFIFKPIYSADMPKRLPLWDITSGLMKSVGRAVRYWLQSTLVAIAWLGVVPLTACRIYRCLFTGSVSSLLTLPLDMLSTENLVADCLQGCFVVTCTLCAFIGLVWLREQILHGGGQVVQENNDNVPAQQQQAVEEAQDREAEQAEQGEVAEQPVGEEVAAQPEDREERGVPGNDNPQQENDWNPIEWDRAAEELTWERLLGLDGSLVFLEHVFWVVSLNTLFILVFAFCPYHIGRFTVMGLKLEDYLAATQFEGLLTAFFGYVIISVTLVILQALAARATFNKLKHILSLSYMVVKVSILVVIEIGIFPLVCGWWLDICSLNMFETSLKDRASSFRQAPGTSVFIHWLVGMVYVFYFASFILLLREVLRPGVLWFLRNLNDPEFNPINEMIHLPVYRHIRRFLASMVIFGSTVLMMLWFPIRLIRSIFPGFLPYNVMLSSDAPVSELSLELLLLQVVLPALLEQGYTRQWLKGVIRKWCIGVAWLLDLRSYLLGEQEAENMPPARPQPADVMEEAAEPVQDEAVLQPDNHPVDQQLNQLINEQPNNPANQQDDNPANQQPANPPEARVAGPAAGGLGAAHQAMLLGGAPVGFQPYEKPDWFIIRLVVLVVLMCCTLFLGSVVSYVVPVWLGRFLMSFWMKEARVHELYTAACGLYSCWLLLRGLSVLSQWLPKGWIAIASNLRQWLSLLGKSLVVAVMLVGVVPLLLGILFELIVVIPLRVPLEQSPLFFPWQDWALGILHAKIVCAVTLMSPHWWLRRIIEQVYNHGWRNMDVLFILKKLCFPVIGCLSLCIALPYVGAKSVVFMLGLNFDQENVVVRRIYPSLMCITLFITYLVFQVKQFKKLYEHIKNDKYLVGQCLVNYENPLRQS